MSDANPRRPTLMRWDNPDDALADVMSQAPTPEERAREVLHPQTHVGALVRRWCAPPLLEDLEQSIAHAIRLAERSANRCAEDCRIRRLVREFADRIDRKGHCE